MKTTLLLCLTLVFSAQIALSTTNQHINNNPSSRFVSEDFDFEIVKGMLFVKASLNNKEGNFIIDTGSPEMVLNHREIASNGFIACGINGQMTTEWKIIRNFKWAGIFKKRIVALTMDLEHLEKITQKEILGIIGYDFLKSFDLYLDYKNRYGRLEKHKAANKNEIPYMVIPFKLQEHLPVVRAKIGKRFYSFGLDTGAGVNVINQCKLKRLNKDLTTSNPIKTHLAGLSKHVNTNTSLIINEAEIRKEAFENMRFVFTDISHFNKMGDFLIDGFLGYPFLKNGRFSICYKKRKIYVWDYNDRALNLALAKD